MSQAPELRIGDAEREAAVTALGDHYAAGRLSKDEYDERADLAWAAKTSSALWPLFADLPRPQAAAPVAARSRSMPRSDRGHPGWWFGAWMAPVLLVVLALVVFTNLPLIVLLILVWVLLARSGRHWSRNRGPSTWPHGHR